MNLKIVLPLAILITGFTACNNNAADPEFNYQNIVTADSTDPVNGKLLADTAVNKIQPAVVTSPVTSNTTTPTTITTTTTGTTGTTSAGLNPEHGKPGHRCDIVVGAPLNSKPVTTSPQIQPQPVTTSPSPQIQSQPVTVSPNKTVTKPGMNPPHGEPGHRCEIAVGAPLNQPAKTTPQQNIKSVSPLLSDSIKK